jgi:hypothetical protein
MKTVKFTNPIDVDRVNRALYEASSTGAAAVSRWGIDTTSDIVVYETWDSRVGKVKHQIMFLVCSALGKRFAKCTLGIDIDITIVERAQ